MSVSHQDPVVSPTAGMKKPPLPRGATNYRTKRSSPTKPGAFSFARNPPRQSPANGNEHRAVANCVRRACTDGSRSVQQSPANGRHSESVGTSPVIGRCDAPVTILPYRAYRNKPELHI